MSNSLQEIVAAEQKLAERKAFNQLEFYQPYPFQQRFHAAKDMRGGLAMQRLLMAGNQVGKTIGGANETAMHATGIYPDWWKGHRLDGPKKGWCGGANNDKVRDICQYKLFGNPEDPDDFGKGAVPRECILKTTRKPGIPNAFESVLVRHKSGKNVSVVFKSYDAAIADWMSDSVDFVWLDEEPEQLVYSQALARTISTGGIIYMTFTPEMGMTLVVTEFRNNLKPGQALFQAGWDDAPHLTPEVQAQLSGAFLPHELEMRRRGEPVLGSGMVFPIALEDILCDPFPIPDHYARIAGLDFGWDHPTAVAWEAHDKEADVLYIHDAYKRAKEVPAVHAEAIKARGAWIPVAWPHDGNRNIGYKDTGAGASLAGQYRALGVNMLGSHFTNPTDAEGKENFAVEPGIVEMLTRMRSGRLKVFATLTEWTDEARGYHRKEGKIVPLNDDLMSASRYGVQSRRYATVYIEPSAMRPRALGTLDEYDPYAA